MTRLKAWGFLFAAVVIWLGAQAVVALAEEVLPKPETPFKGKVDISRDKSTPDWPQEVGAPAGAPNIVLVLLDDVGFGATSVMGGPVETPELEKLAASGLRYNQFHVNAMCSPTRAALLSGRNSHEVGFGAISEFAAGYPGYNSVWSKSDASIAEVLKQNGYSTAAFGKWHNTPVWEVSPAGPFDRWPTGQGFEYFYGFLGAATSQWEPQLYRNTVAVEPPAPPVQGYHLTTDLADDAIRWLHQHDAVVPDKPFFLYFAPGATHAPHQVAREWIDKYKGKFSQGWDNLREETFARQKRLHAIPADAALSPRPAELPAWDSLSADEKRLFARQMEVYAGFLAHGDHEVGRVLQAIENEGKADNTLVLYIVGDNGAAAEGGPTGFDGRTPKGTPDDVATQLKHIDQLGSELYFNLYAGAWGWAMNAPFPWAKMVASHLGGITDPLLVSWPARIKDRGTIRSQFHHVVDIVPTVYEVAGIKAPAIVNGVKQTPLEGASLAYSFDHPQAPSPRKLQYFETLGNRGIYKDGWFAGRRFLLPWGGASDWKSSIDQHAWELYNLGEDYSQTQNLADTYPAKLAELVEVFDQEARRNNVYPIAPYQLSQPSPAPGRTSFTYREEVTRLPVRSAPNLSARSHSFTADVEIPSTRAEGVIFAEGGRRGGFCLYLKDGKVVYELNTLGQTDEKIISSVPISPGRARITFDFIADAREEMPGPVMRRAIGPGIGRLSVNGMPAGEAHFAWFGGFISDTFDVGSDLGSPVSNDYTTPFPFTGKVEKITLELK